MWKIAFLVVFCISQVQGCHTVEHGGSRKRRSAQDELIYMRSFFDDCMTQKYGDLEDSFISEVDYVVLDSVWYDRVGTSGCINNKDDAECWKENLDNFIIQGQVGKFIKKCIDQYQDYLIHGKEKRSLKDSSLGVKYLPWNSDGCKCGYEEVLKFGATRK